MGTSLTDPRPRRRPVKRSRCSAEWVAAAVFAAIATFAAGWLSGVDHANDQLPKCQEDEYLYPAQDYKGPGKNNTADYGCFHFDD
jgi:hypothetical protein